MFFLPYLIPEPNLLLIVEVLYDPVATADRSGEYVELANLAPYPLELEGVTLSTTLGQTHTLTPARGTTQIEPYGLLLLGPNSDRTENGGLNLDYLWSDITLSNSSDTLSLSIDTLLIDSFDWGAGTGLPDPAGASLQLSSHCLGLEQPLPVACWCTSQDVWPGGQDRGSPGQPNALCEAPPDPDQDLDGVMGPQVGGPDCDDQNNGVYPEAEDVPYDGIDQDCSGSDRVDVDEDGWSATQVEGSDCDDTNPDIHPGAPEAEAPDKPDGLDNDCDGLTDEGTVVVDDDHDGLTELEGDCDDTSAAITLSAPEIQDGHDNNCDGLVDPMTSDQDLDGYTPSEGDCNDSQNEISPAAPELFNAIDDNCNGIIDDQTEHADDDDDGFSEEQGDCDDVRADHSPAAPDICGDGLDQNCDGQPAPCPTGGGCTGGTLGVEATSGSSASTGFSLLSLWLVTLLRRIRWKSSGDRKPPPGIRSGAPL